MQNTKTKILTLLLLSAISLAMLPLVNASLGNILVDSTGPIQPLPIASVPAGGNISLYFGVATFSGSQFYLLLSADGLSQVSVGDLRYTPLFNVAAVMDLTIAPVVLTDPNFPGRWIVGQGWVNGTLPQNIPGGLFYVKAFDGATAALAVTQGIPIIASFGVEPIVGAAGTSLLLRGNAFPANSLVNLTYFNPISATYVTINNLTQTNALGQFNYTTPAPDLKVQSATGSNPQASNVIEFQATLHAATPAVYFATYTENVRGLLQFGRPGTGGNLQTAAAGNVFGNNTDFTALVSVGVGDTLRIVGNWFYPGNATFKWDNSVVLTASNQVANGTGFFNTTITVPTTGNGGHNLTIVDSNNVVFQAQLTIVQSITINPTSGPIGQVVTVTGFGFPASTGTNVFNATITFDTTARGWALTDANGAFTTTITVPTATGGAHTITATTNSTVVSAFKTFTVTSAFVVSPTSFYANSSNTEVKGMGTGFDPAKTYFVAIDNQFSPFTNTTNGIIPSSSGNINFSFVGVGFTTGMHVVSVYEAGLGSGLNRPYANATFTVLADPSSDMLAAINKTITGMDTNITNIHGDLVVIAGDTAFIRTATGTTIPATLSSLQATLSSIQNSIAGIQTPNLGPITTSLSAISAQITNLSGNTATISSSVGTLQTSLDSIGARVTTIDGNTATIKTDLGTLQGTVTSISGNIATIQTSLGTIQTSLGTIRTDISGVQTGVNAVQADVTSSKAATESLSPLIIVAIVLALIAAIAAIASIVLMRRKIAG